MITTSEDGVCPPREEYRPSSCQNSHSCLYAARLASMNGSAFMDGYRYHAYRQVSNVRRLGLQVRRGFVTWKPEFETDTFADKRERQPHYFSSDELVPRTRHAFL